jgi:threonine synthase
MPPAPHFRTASLDAGFMPTQELSSAVSLGFDYDGPPVSDPRYAASLWRFWRALPIADPARAVSLGEGNTPLLPSRMFDGRHVFWKDESRNPTGSHKDRALAVAASHAVERGARTLAVVSAGSTGLSAAAYGARAGLASLILIARGAPRERVYPAFVLGARLIEVDAGIDLLIDKLRSLSSTAGLYVASTTRSSNAHQAEGAKTIAYEVCEQLGDAPDWFVAPVGGGGTIAAIFRGFCELRNAGMAKRVPRLVAVVPSAYDAIAAAFTQQITEPAAFAALPYRDDVPTVLTKLAHAHPPDGIEALAAIRASHGVVMAIADDAALDAVARIGAADGLYLEPSSAVLAPAIEAIAAKGIFRPEDTIVALAGGSGFRETFVLGKARPMRCETLALADLPNLVSAP